MTNTLYFKVFELTPSIDIHYWEVRSSENKTIASAHNHFDTRDEAIKNCVEVFGPLLREPDFLMIFDQDEARDKIRAEYERQFPQSNVWTTNGYGQAE
ncbi:gp084 [Rhodococcus phage ReqiPepy6]|uniref:Gp084 n=1 Tax=Rhodococcus phage ReqiPepy6 TaxID=691965 RepID=D4P7J5_9CAUD|nr:gp084 [Rhodococcus phage ReqiPepy6]ADD80975.1 gp084 [Rhodococcus phage ReqiPepy6]